MSINWRLFFFYIEYYILKLLFKQNITFCFKKSEIVLKHFLHSPEMERSVATRLATLRWWDSFAQSTGELPHGIQTGLSLHVTKIFELLDHAGVLYKISFLSDICVLPLHMQPKYSFVVYFLYALLKKLKEQERLFDFMFSIRTWEKCNIKFSGSIMEPYSYSNLPNTHP